jgi:acetyl esterase/lipase
VSPVFANVEGLSPLYIQVGEDEILLSDSERIADECIAAGIEVELEVWPGMWHVFQVFIGKMPEARRAIDKIGNYIQSRWT